MTKPQNQTKQFRVGDVVTWTSQANGKYRIKVGIVMTVVKPYLLPPHSMGLNRSRSEGRDHDSYIVGVPHTAGKKMEFFFPRVNHLDYYKNELMLVN